MVVDIDRTLCDSREADHLLPPKDTPSLQAFQNWHQFVATTDFPTVANAYLGFATVLSTAEPDKIIFLTSRSESLREATEKWIQKHVGDLLPKDYVLNMRPLDDLAPGPISKFGRMLEVRIVHPEAEFIFIDDEASGLGLATGENDAFVYIRDCDWNKAMMAFPVDQFSSKEYII
jgi:hypothetical protein